MAHISNKEDIGSDFLQQLRVLVIVGPQGKYSELEFDHLRKYLSSGGNMLVMVGEGGEKKSGTNINFLLEEYGISINNDTVLRTSYYKYFHPKEALISHGVLNRTVDTLLTNLMAESAGEKEMTANRSATSRKQKKASSAIDETASFGFVYPFGGTLNVVNPAVAIMSTGTICFPVNRPIIAFSSASTLSLSSSFSQNDPSPTNGNICVVGSCHLFHDTYIQQEGNFLVNEVIFRFLTQNSFPLDPIDARNPEVSDYIPVPDLDHLSNQPISCLEEGESVPVDFTKLFTKSLYSLDNTSHHNLIISLMDMNLDHEPLRLIKPQFEIPLPPLVPALFPPNFRLPAKPDIELFDLDDAFSSCGTRLMQLANKCTDDDVEYYVKESAFVLGVEGSLHMTSKQILHSILTKLVQYKKVNSDEGHHQME